jgi:hypothetical protein
MGHLHAREESSSSINVSTAAQGIYKRADARGGQGSHFDMGRGAVHDRYDIRKCNEQ